MARLIIMNEANDIQGKILAVLEDSHVLSPAEDFVEWVKDGRDPNDWHRQTVLIEVPDKTKAELSYLTDLDEFTEEPKYSFNTPDGDSDIFLALKDEKNITKPWNVVEQYLNGN